jgi:hypothetical protein
LNSSVSTNDLGSSVPVSNFILSDILIYFLFFFP